MRNNQTNKERKAELEPAAQLILVSGRINSKRLCFFLQNNQSSSGRITLSTKTGGVEALKAAESAKRVISVNKENEL